MGKPLVEARGEVRYAADYLRWFAEQAPRVAGEHRVLPDGSSRMLTTPRPVGVCVLVTPWNFPAAMITRKLAPAIAAGCTSVVKPAEDTPLTTLALARLFERAGLPAGVLNVVPTDEPASLVAALLADGRARKLSFTGSTEVGRHLLGLAAPQVMRTSMELGGNAPFIVCDDADLELAVGAAMEAKFRNGGQACTAANRFLVHAAVADEFSEALVERVSQLQLGSALEADTTLGPLIHHAAVTRTHCLVRDAVERGATVRTGGDSPARRGSFYQPTVLTGVPVDADVARQEVFAPVVSISTFTSIEEALSMANSTEFGLVAYLFTGDAELILSAGERLDFGMVAVNRGLVSNAAAPFGGIKHSGLGREGSTEGINEYLDYTYTALSL